MAADIRACVAHVRAEYKPTSLGLMGFCYGGGRALEEAAAGNTMSSSENDMPRFGSKIILFRKVASFMTELPVSADW